MAIKVQIFARAYFSSQLYNQWAVLLSGILYSQKPRICVNLVDALALVRVRTPGLRSLCLATSAPPPSKGNEHEYQRVRRKISGYVTLPLNENGM